jgi:ribosome-binding ATPase YchF (GTP1/OBG family)
VDSKSDGVPLFNRPCQNTGNDAFVLKVKNMRYVLCYSKVPAFLNVVDIAGLVKGASEGQGLGNAFLSHIKACDALFHLCRKYLC